MAEENLQDSDESNQGYWKANLSLVG